MRERERERDILRKVVGVVNVVGMSSHLASGSRGNLAVTAAERVPTVPLASARAVVVRRGVALVAESCDATEIEVALIDGRAACGGTRRGQRRPRRSTPNTSHLSVKNGGVLDVS